ncbi:MAG: hypothetical protein FWC89_00275 [Defluviitaleaceae bacterium]|nr:hypothetical protein [Defluviitaleaceae bacterium]
MFKLNKVHTVAVIAIVLALTFIVSPAIGFMTIAFGYYGDISEWLFLLNIVSFCIFMGMWWLALFFAVKKKSDVVFVLFHVYWLAVAITHAMVLYSFTVGHGIGSIFIAIFTRLSPLFWNALWLFFTLPFVGVIYMFDTASWGVTWQVLLILIAVCMSVFSIFMHVKIINKGSE